MQPGSRLGPYEIVAPLGAGGMGEVYRARDLRLGREVAIKVLPAEVASDPERLARFEREARALAALTHPNILAIHEFDREGDVAFIVTELLEGETLRNRLSREHLPWRKAVEIGAAIADGLAVAHARRLIHRDLKPENLFISHDGAVKILDFGLARREPEVPFHQAATSASAAPDATTPGTRMGTVGYMAPEQVRGEPADARSDIFALGCVLFELLTGRRAFARATSVETMVAILKEPVPEPSSVVAGVPRELDRLVSRCLAKLPGERFQSASDLAYALRAVAAPSEPAQTDRDEARDDRPSIAVLPFANLSADPEQEYFCDGMAEEVINALAHVHGLRVIARTSSFAFKGRSEDIREIGARLDVATLLEGSVRKAGDRLRITAQLINVADGSHLWSERYDRRLEDVFAIQDEIALAIVAALEVRLLGRERAAIERPATVDLDAYSAYLKGLYHWNKLSPEGFARSRECFEEAIRIDPAYAPAYNGLGMWFISQALWADLPPEEAWPQCKRALEKALSLEPDSAMAHAGMGTLLAFSERRWQAAEESLRRGTALGPNAAAAHLNLAVLLTIRRRWDEAAAEARVSLRLDPLSAPNCAWSADCLDAAGHHEEGRAELERVIALDPTHWLPHWALSLLAARGGRPEEARAEGEEAVRLSGGASASVALLACACYALGDGQRGEALRAQLEARAQGGHVPPSHFAWMDAARHEVECAVRWLECAADIRDPSFATYRMIPPTLVGSDARIEAVLSRFDL